MEEWFKTFSANCCNWISIRYHAVRRVELIGYSVRFGHPILFRVFHCQNKSVGLYNGIISHTVQLHMILFTNVISFCLNFIVEQYIIAKLGTFLWATRYIPSFWKYRQRNRCTFKGHSRSSALSSFARWPGISTRDRKCRLHLFLDKNS